MNVLVTGGSGGIGSIIVEKFVQEGDFVYFIDKDPKGAKLLTERFGHDKCQYQNVDVTKISDIRAFANSFDKNFELDYLITLAGRALENEWISFPMQELSEIHNSVNVNLLGHINVIHEFYKYLRNGSAVVMVSSINAIGNYGLPGYSASKAGLYGFMNAVVNEFGRDGIRINTISPGTVVTEATQKEPKDFGELLKGTAIGRFATPIDIANVAYELCHTFVSITGQNLIVDSGQSKMH